MSVLTIVVLFLVLTVVMILVGIPIAFSIGLCTIGAIYFAMGSGPLTRVGLIPYSVLYSQNYLPLPLFMLMACIIGETKMGEDIFDTANKWLCKVPGGLLVASVVGEGVMAATMGSSGTTIMTIGTIVDPEIKRLNYNREFGMATLLAAGVLGPLIPPSVNFIVYAAVTQTSVSQLFLAGVVPGILLILMLAAMVIITCIIHPDWAPRPKGVSWKERILSLRKVWSVLVLIIAIVGGIFSGAVTATEAGALGVVVTLIIAVVAYNFRFKQLVRAMGKAMSLTGMVGLMFIAVNSFTYIVAVSGLADNLGTFVKGLNVPPIVIIFVINIILLILGCVMDSFAIMMVTLPLFMPIINALGYDPVWFGVLVCVNIEIGLISPPVGLSLFMVSGMFDVNVKKLIRSVLPFLAMLIVFLFLLILFPQISMWLPNLSSAV